MWGPKQKQKRSPALPCPARRRGWGRSGPAARGAPRCRQPGCDVPGAAACRGGSGGAGRAVTHPGAERGKSRSRRPRRRWQSACAGAPCSAPLLAPSRPPFLSAALPPSAPSLSVSPSLPSSLPACCPPASLPLPAGWVLKLGGWQRTSCARGRAAPALLGIAQRQLHAAGRGWVRRSALISARTVINGTKMSAL